MPKFKIYAFKKTYYTMEVEANTANEAEEIYWDRDDLGIETDDVEIKVDEIHDEDGNVVVDFEKDYSMRGSI
jgi:hypothetical protein